MHSESVSQFLEPSPIKKINKKSFQEQTPRGLAAATKKIVKKAKRKDPDCITLSSDEEDEEETVIEFEEDDEVGFLILKLLTP